jgi:putative iron-regulated protein
MASEDMTDDFHRKTSRVRVSDGARTHGRRSDFQMIHRLLTTSALAAALATSAQAQSAAEVLDAYADIAAAKYEDSLIAARALQDAVDALVAEPSAEALHAARAAWLKARVPYQQTEVYRFGNAIVDDWEGRVNAWPLDEGLIDYVDGAYGGPTDENPLAALNVIANPVFTLSGAEIDATEIDPGAAAGHAARGRRRRGQCRHRLSRHRISALGAGSERPWRRRRRAPWTDYAQGEACTGGNCDRRAAYLSAATELLTSDLDGWRRNGPRAARPAPR